MQSNDVQEFFHRCRKVDEDSVTACNSHCDLVTLVLGTPDMQKEPKGALDATELQLAKESFFSTIPELTEPFIRCLVYESHCQPFGILSDNDTLNYFWVST